MWINKTGEYGALKTRQRALQNHCTLQKLQFGHESLDYFKKDKLLNHTDIIEILQQLTATFQALMDAQKNSSFVISGARPHQTTAVFEILEV